MTSIFIFDGLEYVFHNIMQIMPQRFLQKSLVLAEIDGSCRTRRFLLNMTVLAELNGSCRTRWILQNLMVLAELDGSRRQNSTVLAGQVLPFHHPFGRYSASYIHIVNSA